MSYSAAWEGGGGNSTPALNPSRQTSRQWRRASPLGVAEQDEAFRQLALGLEHDTRAGLRNIGDRASLWRRRAVKQNAGIVMEIPARLSAQFGLVAKFTDHDHQKLRVPRTGGITNDLRNITLRSRKLSYAGRAATFVLKERWTLEINASGLPEKLGTYGKPQADSAAAGGGAVWLDLALYVGRIALS
jgi:hypothetical protein